MRLFFYGLFLLLFPSYVWSANISGILVNDKASPIVGAYIIHLQSEHHAHSNEFGKFFIRDVKVGDTLQIIHIGYETLLYPIDNVDEDLRIEMKESYFELGEVVVGQNRKKANIIAAIDVETSPVNSAQEILRKVPGLFIGQHAGGGKAEQIFLRGFDIDHGTDVAISIDGMPVNMVSHAHGQGYADLHFIIPETLDKIDFGKGPYYADKGNFSTAGYVQFKTKDVLEESQVSLEYGAFNTMRTLGMLNLLDTENHNVYVAADYSLSDGPFNSSQNFHRRNLFAKYSGTINKNDHLSVLVSNFSSTWDASGQIPQRAVDSGLIDRFGAIDDTEGGTTNRSNLAINYNKVIDDKTFITNSLYYSTYDFELFSNFTFFLNDPENGDQIRQSEERSIFGFQSVLNRSDYLGDASVLYQLGVGLRSDDIDENQLSRTKNRRETLSRVQYGDVDENNLFAFASAEFDLGDWSFQPGVRVDYFKFNYVDNLNPVFDRLSQTKSTVSPKFNVIYNMNNSVQLFAKSGVGFHSNDSRVVLQNTSNSVLPPAYGFDLGAVVKPAKRLIANMAFWYLFLEQEFVYVGDEGIVEPSGRTRRVGFDFGLRYQLTDWLFASGDVNYALPRSIDDPEGENLIPLAPNVTATAGIYFKKKNFTSNIQMRYLKDRPANEDNSIVAIGYMITDFNATYSFSRISLGLSVENIFDREWNETQFATESRLNFEAESTEEIHFTPGVPLFVKGIVKYKF